MRKFAFLDLDGTIIDHNQVISSKVNEAITSASENGHKVFIATGRSYPELYPFLFSLPFSGLITANGAYVEVGEQVLSSHSIDQDGISEWMGYFRRSGASWLWQCRDHFYPSETFLDFFRLSGKSERATSGDWSAYLEQIMPYVTNGTPSSAEKCVFYLSPEASSSVEEAHSLFGDRYMVIPGSVRVRAGEMVEVGVKGVNKRRPLSGTRDWRFRKRFRDASGGRYRYHLRGRGEQAIRDSGLGCSFDCRGRGGGRL